MAWWDSNEDKPERVEGGESRPMTDKEWKDAKRNAQEHAPRGGSVWRFKIRELIRGK